MFLRQKFFEDRGKAPGAQALTDAIATVTAREIFEGREERVFLRIADLEGTVYVGLCNDGWEALGITPNGWRVGADPPVKFTRNKNSAPLPYPERGGSVDGLRSFLNVEEDGFKLSVGWVVGAFNPSGPYPVLEIIGEQGTAKSTTSRVLRSLVDPAAKVPLRSLATNERDLAIFASCNWVLGFDNLSYIRPHMSDAMCRLATGGEFGTRTLYTDGDETLFDATHPQIVNGINAVALRGDLQERSISITCSLSQRKSGGKRRGSGPTSSPPIQKSSVRSWTQ